MPNNNNKNLNPELLTHAANYYINNTMSVIWNYTLSSPSENIRKLLANTTSNISNINNLKAPRLSDLIDYIEILIKTNDQEDKSVISPKFKFDADYQAVAKFVRTELSKLKNNLLDLEKNIHYLPETELISFISSEPCRLEVKKLSKEIQDDLDSRNQAVFSL